MPLQKRVHVAVAVIRNKIHPGASQILITQRAKDAHQGGLWEFPGGKVEASETVQQALGRELEEELGITIEQETLEPLIQIRHDYPDKHVLLDVWFVDDFSGEPYGREGQPLQWVGADELHTYAFPAANLPIIRAVNLPRRYLITPEFDTFREFQAYIKKSMAFGFSLIQVRQHHLEDGIFLNWAEELMASLDTERQAQIVWNRALPVLNQLPIGSAWHLNSASLVQAVKQHQDLPSFFGASCHNAEELALAESLGVSYALLSPVHETLSHIGQSALGFARFEEMVSRCTVPVYALGGLDESNMHEAVSRGAQGIAAIRGWQSMITVKEGKLDE